MSLITALRCGEGLTSPSVPGPWLGAPRLRLSRGFSCLSPSDWRAFAHLVSCWGTRAPLWLRQKLGRVLFDFTSKILKKANLLAHKLWILLSFNSAFFSLKKKKLSGHTMWHAEFSCLGRDRTHARPAVEAGYLNHWSTRFLFLIGSFSNSSSMRMLSHALDSCNPSTLRIQNISIIPAKSPQLLPLATPRLSSITMLLSFWKCHLNGS